MNLRSKIKLSQYRFLVGRKIFFHRFYIIEERGFTSVLPKEVVCEQYPWFANAIDADDPRALHIIESLRIGMAISIKQRKYFLAFQFGYLQLRSINPPMKPSTPNYLTESELIKKMVEKGIGTDGSVPRHIAKICDRGYVQVS